MNIITEILDDGRFVFDAIDPEAVLFYNCENYIEICDLNSLKRYFALKVLKDNNEVVFSPYLGYYIAIKQLDLISDRNKNVYLNVFNNGDFPYKLINYNYAAELSMDFFNNLEHSYLETATINHKYALSEHLPYTFGIEFETSSGYVPEDNCLHYGLIPLRDGSISGVEYSTIVLSGNSGIDLLTKQMEILNKYTLFNKECALHIHFGGFPLDPKKILRLNNVFSYLINTESFLSIIPTATFRTSLYKKNKKDYCSGNVEYYTFDDLFFSITGRPYFGSLKQPHPADVNKMAKWNIKSRYVGCNLVNMCCYDNPKTVEFRFLRPTQNVHVIIFWLYILNAILRYSEKDAEQHPDLRCVLAMIYPKDIYKSLLKAIEDMRVIRMNQKNNGDCCNSMFFLENNFKLNDNLI